MNACIAMDVITELYVKCKALEMIQFKQYRDSGSIIV